MKGSYYRYSKLSLTWCSSCLCVKLLLGPSSGPEGDPVWLFCHSKQLIIWFNIFKRQSYSLEPCDQFAIWMFVASFSAEKAAFGFILTELWSNNYLWVSFMIRFPPLLGQSATLAVIVAQSVSWTNGRIHFIVFLVSDNGTIRLQRL